MCAIYNLCALTTTGNIFDWGAQAVTQIRENTQKFGLDEALRRIQSRPWLIDGLDRWLLRLQTV